MCGVQIRLLDAAHNLPGAYPESTYGTNNGLGLSTLQHRAYDRAFVAFSSDIRTHVNEGMAKELKATDHGDGLERFK